MTLSYDVSLMQQLVAACQTANDEIVKAQQQIQAVKSHGDWTCKEKSVIDELMEDCKNLINRMQEDQNGFLNVLKQVEGELDGAEKSISNLFQGVESILGKILSIPTAVTTVVGGGLIGAASGVGEVIGSGIGTGGWIQSGIDWISGIGAEIIDTEIWHGPIPIDGVAEVWDNMTDVFEGVGDEMGHWADTVINTPILICRMGDIQL